MDIGILTETKLSGIHTTSAYGYTISATKTARVNQGGVALIQRASKEWHLESTRHFGENVIRSTLVMGRERLTIVGVYIPRQRRTPQQSAFWRKPSETRT